MQKKNKVRAIIATATAGVVIGVGAMAVAAFVQTNQVQATGTAAKFEPVTMSGDLSRTSNILPGDSLGVTLTLTNSAANTVKAKTELVTGAGVVVTAGTVPAGYESYCAGFVTQGATSADLPTLDADGVGVPVTIANIVAIGDAPIECQGMQFTTKWTVTFSPVRAA